MKTFNLIFILLVTSITSFSQTRQVTIKYQVEAFSIDEYDVETKIWNKGKVKDGGSSFFVILPANEPDINYVLRGDGKSTFNINNKINEKIGEDEYLTFSTIDNNGHSAEITLVFWSDGSRTMTILFEKRKLNFGLKYIN